MGVILESSKTDLGAVRVAFDDTGLSLDVKLRFIWKVLEDTIPEVEKRFSRSLKEAWGNDASVAMDMKTSLRNKARLAASPAHLSSEKIGLLGLAYFQALRTIRAIEQEYSRKFPINADRPLPDGIFERENLESEYFRDKIIPLFFTLHSSAITLWRHADADRWVKADNLVRQKQARLGGLAKGAKDFGEGVLKAWVITYLALQHDDSFSSIEALFQPPNGKILSVWEDYEKSIGQRPVPDGPVITYGEGAEHDFLFNKIKAWKDSDPEFAKILDRVVASKSSLKT